MTLKVGDEVEMCSTKKNRLKLKLFSSWSYFDSGYPELKTLTERKSDLVPDGKYPTLWHTRNKFVLKLTLSDGKELVYKAPERIKGVHKYLFRPGPYGMEALNFSRMLSLGLPMVKLVAAGEERCCFVLKSGFLVTEFASGYRDGRDFIPGGIKEDEKNIVDEFICRNFAYLAGMHASKMIHRGFTPANLLYRLRNEPDAAGNMLDILWIDVASCKMPFAGIGLRRGIARDIALFFHFFDFSREEKLRYLDAYCSNDPAGRFTPETLLELVEKNPVR